MRTRAPLVAAIALLALGGSGRARAHYPHDQAYFVAVSPDPSEPRVATTLEWIELTLIGRSDNGLNWAARAVGAKTAGGVSSGAFLTADRLLIAVVGRGLLASEDAGDSFGTVAAIPDTDIGKIVASPSISEDGMAIVASESGVWRTDDAGETWQLAVASVGAGFSDLDLSPNFAADGRVCALEGGELACSADHGRSWQRSQAPHQAFRLAVGSGTRLWAVVRDDGLYRSVDDGLAWARAGFGGQDPVAVAELSDDLLLVGLSGEAVWVSPDAGRNWSFVDVQRIVVDQSRDGVTVFDLVEGPDGTLYMAAWFGLARSVDRGASWTYYATERPQNAHSVDLTEGDGGALLAWLGTYGSGPVLVDLDTLVAEDFPAMPARFARSSPVSKRWAHDGTALFDEGYTTWRTTDHGASWELIASDAVEGGEWAMGEDVKGVALSPEPLADPFVLATAGQQAMSFMTSDDLGDTWVEGRQEPPCRSDGFAVAISGEWLDNPRAYAACGGAVYVSVDRGQTWAILGDTGASFVFRIHEMSSGAVLVATDDGLWRVVGGRTERLGFDGDLVTSVVAGVGGATATVFALVAGWGWYRSEDGGEAWTQLVAPTDDAARMVAMSPRYAEDGTVVVAGYGGAWVSEDRGESWTSISALDVYESSHDAWTTTGDWTWVEDWEGASAEEVTIADAVGASATLSFEGIGVALEVPVDAEPGALTIRLDGMDAETVVIPGSERAVWAADALPDAWHTLTVTVVGGRGTLDAVVVTRLPARAPSGRADSGADAGGGAEPDPCGCGGGAGAAFLLLPAAWRRRT